ncbi:hypothetical protein B0H67DRAFT_583966 [Lasiosphaeris hirsuta]|uniref:Uncharacterized protein n=1 Tax=Lasiosphaeris hirsuta TaxID=260670 RepID=A0AA40A800_9PEZI|nr:hypothetical protein B0H67DRAFT_583966 [Lasiosphaeris hirsuta]
MPYVSLPEINLQRPRLRVSDRGLGCCPVAVPSPLLGRAQGVPFGATVPKPSRCSNPV